MDDGDFSGRNTNMVVIVVGYFLGRCDQPYDIVDVLRFWGNLLVAPRMRNAGDSAPTGRIHRNLIYSIVDMH